MQLGTETDRQEALEDLQDQLEDNETWAEFQERYQPGTHGFHEALHAASLSVEFVARNVLEHPSIILQADLYAQAASLVEQLVNLQGAIAMRHLGDEDASA